MMYTWYIPCFRVRPRVITRTLCLEGSWARDAVGEGGGTDAADRKRHPCQCWHFLECYRRHGEEQAMEPGT